MAIEVTVTFLEMGTPPARGPRPLPEGALVLRVEHPPVAFYRYLYREVGAPWQWTDRNALSDEELEAILGDPGVTVYVLYYQGWPAGYVEFDARQGPDVQIAYFGLVPQAIGLGLGLSFLDWAVARAWETGPPRVWLHTCTLDHPRALEVYLKAGFTAYRAETVLKE